jgi:GntR family transcriptional regulator, transcriptional repressor for pyruvate dehydrogenase complex
MFTPVKNTKIYEQVVQQIKSMIIDGTLKKGDKLPTERDLAEQLQVSRPTVREAMRALEVVGVIESRQGAGNYIKESFENSLFEPLSMMFMLEESNPHDILELRQVLELEIAVLAAERISDEELLILNELVREMKACNSEDINVELDKKFHYTIAKASRNFLIISVLQVISQLIDDFIKDSRRKILSREENRIRLNAQHELMYVALKNKDGSAAYGAVKEHFRLIEEYFYI